MKIQMLFKSPLKGGFQCPVSCLWVSDGTILEDRILVAKSEINTRNENEFVSMRYSPRITLVRQRVRPNSIVLYLPDRKENSNATTVIDVEKTIEKDQKHTIRIWNEEKDESFDRLGFECNEHCSNWVSGVLGKKVILLLSDKAQPAKDISSNGSKLAFQDVSEMHAVSLSSLLHLGLREDVTVTARRFRPNIVIDTGLPPFGEDSFIGRVMTIGKNKYQVREATARCHVPYLDPITGKSTPYLREYLEKAREIDGKVKFGIYLFPLFTKTGTIETDDDVMISDRE